MTVDEGQLYPELSEKGRHLVNQSLNLVHVNRRNQVLNLNLNSARTFGKTVSNFTLVPTTDRTEIRATDDTERKRVVFSS